MPNYKKIGIHLKNVLVIGVILYFLTVVAFYFAQITPLKRHLNYLQTRTIGLSTEVENLKNQYTQKWEKEKDEVLGIIDSFDKKEGDKDIILSDIFQMAKDSGMEIEKAAPLEDEALGDTMVVYSWRVDCSPDFSTMGTFFNEIETSPLFLSVKAPYIQSGEEDIGKIQEYAFREEIKHRVNFILSTYRFK